MLLSDRFFPPHDITLHAVLVELSQQQYYKQPHNAYNEKQFALPWLLPSASVVLRTTVHKQLAGVPADLRILAVPR